jgi:hypothetical protein
MTGVSLARLHLLRAAYLLVGAGLAITLWPSLLTRGADWTLMNGVVAALLGAVSLLALLGLRYPLQMLPVLLFELLWKTIWLAAIALPMWLEGRIDARAAESVRDCLLGAILIPILPWRYVFAAYVKRPGDPWRKPTAPAGGAEATA